MKSIKRLFMAAIIAVVAIGAATPAAAQLRFGVKVGTEINSLKFDKLDLSSSNRAGFTGGLMLEFTVPVIGIGMDLSAMYVHRSENLDLSSFNAGNKEINKRDYIEIPLNLKYKLSIPVVEKLIKPFVTTGPSFAFLVSKQDFNNFVKNKSCDIAWNFGLGVELLSHVQVAASYGIGLTNTLEFLGTTQNGVDLGKNKYWTVTAAYLF